MTISLLVIAIAFVLLLGALVALCLLVRRVVKRFGKIGHVIEDRISPSCRECHKCAHKIEEEIEEAQKSSPLAVDILEWGLLGVALWQKIKDKRR